MTDRAHFRPFETDLDEDQALAILRGAVAGAHDGELSLERRRSESLVFDDGRLRNAPYDSGEGFGGRAVVGDVDEMPHQRSISPSVTPSRVALTTSLSLVGRFLPT